MGRRPRSRPVDLDDLVWRAATDAREQGPPKIDTTGIAPVRVLGDTAGLRRVVQNLLDNARRHANDTVTVQLRLNFDPRRPVGIARRCRRRRSLSPMTVPESPWPTDNECSIASYDSARVGRGIPGAPASGSP
jgi:signal transduction histidine kinase